MKVNTIMTTEVAFCKGNTRLDDVARLMADHNCSAIPIVDDDKSRKVIGILTDRDIVRRTLARGKNPAGLTAAACMTTDVFVAKQDSEIEECLQTMEKHHVRRLPIIDDKRAVCGIVTLSNLAEFLPAPTVGEVIKEITEPNRKHNGHTAPFPQKTSSTSTKSQSGVSTPALLSVQDIPHEVRKELPAPAQQLYFEAYNSAVQELRDSSKSLSSQQEAVGAATKIAWSAVKQQFQKKGDHWVIKGAPSRG